jgi:hypothetical protein
MTERTLPGDFEGLLRRALAPVEPPADLAVSLESTLESLTELAADELDGWELGEMRDPRNWVRPVAAVLVGTTAGGALVLLRARRRAQGRRHANRGPADAAERALRDVFDEARRLLR